MSYTCPENSYIQSVRWPIKDFTDCKCSWGYYRDNSSRSCGKNCPNGGEDDSGGKGDLKCNPASVLGASGMASRSVGSGDPVPDAAPASISGAGSGLGARGATTPPPTPPPPDAASISGAGSGLGARSAAQGTGNDVYKITGTCKPGNYSLNEWKNLQGSCTLKRENVTLNGISCDSKQPPAGCKSPYRYYSEDNCRNGGITGSICSASPQALSYLGPFDS